MAQLRCFAYNRVVLLSIRDARRGRHPHLNHFIRLIPLNSTQKKKIASIFDDSQIYYIRSAVHGNGQEGQAGRLRQRRSEVRIRTALLRNGDVFLTTGTTTAHEELQAGNQLAASSLLSHCGGPIALRKCR